MNQDQIDDLKQFIATTISQQTADIRDDIEQLRGNMATKTDVTNLSRQVSEAVDTTNEAIDTELKDHELRITKLEQAAT